MKPRLRGSTFVGTLIVLAAAAVPATSFATGTCYAVRLAGTTVSERYGQTPLTIRYLAGLRGAIVTQTEIDKFNHLSQNAYEVDGKATLLLQRKETADLQDETGGIRIMSTTTGSLITGAVPLGKKPVDAPGAHLGLTIHLARFADGVFVGPIFLECTSSEVTPKPSVWKCNAKLELDVPVSLPYVLGLDSPIFLYKVNSADVPACSVFEDGENFPELPGVALP